MSMDAAFWRWIAIAFCCAIIVWFGYTAADTFAAYVPREAIPKDAYRYKAELIRHAGLVWGEGAPVATFAAQIHAESTWRSNAHDTKSSAMGLSMFTRGTAKWVANRYPDLKPAKPLDATWALKALVQFDKYLWDKAGGAPCLRAKHMLASYNAGEGVHRRKSWPRETQRYIQRTLHQLEPLYESAGWGAGSC